MDHTNNHRQTMIPSSMPDPLTQDYNTVHSLSDTERDLLIEYQKLAKNLSQLSQSINKLTSTPTAQVMDTLQGLESKTSLVFTLLKASVYSVFVQNEGGDGEYEEQQQEQEQEDVYMEDGASGYDYY